jgi:L-threonylcarbamoyladenylate synthase
VNIPQTTESLPRIAETITRGGIIAFRTDTFYGLGADPFNRSALQRIKQLKGREADKPILVVISNIDQIERFISKRSRIFDLLAEQFWPGPLTLIGKAALDVPAEITAGTETIGVRLPDDDNVRALVRSCGGALTATSANPSGQAPARVAEDVERYFGAAVDLTVDDGEARSDRPSTVVDASAAEPKLVREGVIAWAEIYELIAHDKTESMQNRER